MSTAEHREHSGPTARHDQPPAPDDAQDFADADRGFLARLDPCVITVTLDGDPRALLTFGALPDEPDPAFPIVTPQERADRGADGAPAVRDGPGAGHSRPDLPPRTSGPSLSQSSQRARPAGYIIDLDARGGLRRGTEWHT
ncbi:hypothetical protein OHT20_35055 [Streptomyces caniferus]|uniref:Uncharacterized protein n=1 Tax=Streptomyces caniferus TaxID=285557 RepID=A0A640SA70_9ACTN|nr:hypothetical protein [Streptomyces caniferus]GFE08060.1 hypothetical protein Scani_43280 [Streptomyces caniferus]